MNCPDLPVYCDSSSSSVPKNESIFVVYCSRRRQELRLVGVKVPTVSAAQAKHKKDTVDGARRR